MDKKYCIGIFLSTDIATVLGIIFTKFFDDEIAECVIFSAPFLIMSWKQKQKSQFKIRFYDFF